MKIHSDLNESVALPQEKKVHLISFLVGFVMILIVIVAAWFVIVQMQKKKIAEQKAFEVFVQQKQEAEVSAVYQQLSASPATPPTAKELESIYKTLSASSSAIPLSEAEIADVYTQLNAAAQQKQEALYAEFKASQE